VNPPSFRRVSGSKRIVVLRGAQANPWDLRVWEDLDAGVWDVAAPVFESNFYDTSLLGLERPAARALSDYAPGPVRGLAARAPVNRYLGLRELLQGADIVHAAELSFWFTAQAARLKRDLGFRLVVTVWETIPFRETYRNRLTRRLRREVLAVADRYLAASERADECLVLEGVPTERVEVVHPGIDVERFGVAAKAAEEHVVVSPGRLVWEKGHQDVLRALTALRRGLVDAPVLPRMLIVGAGGEEDRLRRYAADLGVADRVRWRRSVPYDEMPDVYAEASAVVLASLPISRWEEQFGMVLAEAMAAGLPIVAARSGAIPEVAGESADYVVPGDWMGIARALAAGPLARPPAERVEHPRAAHFSTRAAAERLDAAYRRVLA
jgi:glycosyltransferase involved in cell wall biosynthesis